MKGFKWKDVAWVNVLFFLYIHTTAFYAVYLLVSGQAMISAFSFAYIYVMIGAMSTAVGAHRLWAHKSFKATWQLSVLLMIGNSSLFLKSIFIFARDHRVHHKFTETNADPHNYNRGFFFSHIGWLMLKKHRDVLAKGATIDMSDLRNDGIVMFQHKYYFLLMPFFTFVIPTFMSHYVFGETLANSWYVSGVLRYVIGLQLVFCVNSLAHSDFLAARPYDRFIRPSDHKTLSFFMFGENSHNFHHTFPWDYKSSELNSYVFNVSTSFIHLMHSIGWAYDLRTVSQEIIDKRAARTGDDSRYESAELRKDDDKKHYTNKNEGIICSGWDDPEHKRKNVSCFN